MRGGFPNMSPRRSTWKTLAAGIGLAVIGIACDFAKPICGCTPTVFLARAAGTITDAAGAPVANTPYVLIGLPAGRTFTPPATASEYNQKTDANGKFATEVSGGGEIQEIHAAVYPAGRSVVVVKAGTATFHMNGFGPDTVNLSIVLPP
jgi:hypothetical protein